MPPGIGFSFQPGQDAQQSMQDAPFGQSPSASTPQQAVQIRSLRVPKTLPSNAPVSRSLLTAPGSAGPGASDLMSFVQALRQLFQPQPSQPDAPMLPTFPQQGPMPSQGPAFEGNYDTDPLQAAPQLPAGGGGHGSGGSQAGGGSGNLNAFSLLDLLGKNQNPYGTRVQFGDNDLNGPAKGFNMTA